MSQNHQFMEDLKGVKEVCDIAIEDSEKVLKLVTKGDRLLPRSLDSYDAATLRTFVSALFGQLQENIEHFSYPLKMYNSYLAKPNYINELHTCLNSAENLMKLNNNFQKAEDNSERLANIEQTYIELNGQFSSHMAELKNIKSLVVTLPPPDLSEYHSTQMKELETLKSAILSKPDLPQPPPPVIDYTKIAALIPTPPPSHQPSATDIRREVTRSHDQIERRSNLMIYGLHPVVENGSAYDSVKSLFDNCEIGTLSRLSCDIQHARFLNRDKNKSVIQVAMKSRFHVEEILSVAKFLKDGAFPTVYISKDRTREEREQRRELVIKLKSTILEFPKKLWGIVGDKVVEKGLRPNVK